MARKVKLSISLDSELAKWLREVALAENRNVSNVIETYLQAIKKQIGENGVFYK
jgi:predicted transcriptional regulator